MTSNRAKSPDKYIGITKNSQDHYLSKEEKRILLNVYGVLRKEVRLSVTGAAARAADLCGVSVSALFSAKKEFDTNFDSIKILNRSLDPLGDVSVQYDENNQARNLSGLQPCNTEVYSVVKAKILEMLGISGTATFESVVEAFQKDPQLPNLEESAIRHVLKQLNLTSYMPSAVSEAVEGQESKWDIPIKDDPRTPAAVSAEVAPAAQIADPEDECLIVYYAKKEEIVDLRDAEKKVETTLPSHPFEFHACLPMQFKTEGEDEEEEVKREVVDLVGHPVIGDDGGFPPAETESLSGDLESNSTVMFPDGANSYECTNVVGGENLPFAGILVYGLNAMNASNSTDPTIAGIPSGVQYVPNDPAAIFPDTPPSDIAPQWQPLSPKIGKRPRDRRYRSCNACRRMFDRRGPLCQHLGGGKRHKLPPLVCRYCPRSFSGRRCKQFVQHTMFVHTMRSLSCDFCRDVSFDSAARLVRHVSNAHMDVFLEQQGVVVPSVQVVT